MEKNTEFKKERNQEHDTWLIFLCSSFAFLLGCVVNSFMSSDLGFSEFIPTIGALLAGIISYWGSKKNTADTLKIQKEINDQNNSFQEDMQKSQIDADITANARINWIQITRAKISTFISNSYELLTFFDPNNYSEGNRMELLNIKRQNLRESAIQLGIMFGPDEADLNQKVVRFADLIAEEAIQSQGMDYEYMTTLQEQFIVYRNFLNYYLKIEWKRANLSLSDDEAKKKQLENPMKKKLEDLLKEKEERLRKNREARISALKSLQE